jgi:PAS domain S-box-containing protein
MENIDVIKIFENLNKFSIIINNFVDFDHTLSAILNEVLDLARMEKGGIYLKDVKTGDYILTMHTPISEEFQEKHGRITKDWTSLHPVMHEGKVVTVTDTLIHIPNADPERQKLVINEGFRSYAGIPLKNEDVIIGILMVSSTEVHEFSETEIRMLSIIGRQIGSSITTAELLKKLRKSRDYYDLISNTRDVIYSHDFDGNFLSMNQAGLELLECTKGELRQSNMSDFLSEDSLEMMSIIKQCLIEGINIEFPPILEIISKKGKRSFYEFSITPIFKNNKPVGIHGIARNVDKRLLAEKNLLIFSKAINLSSDGIIISDADDKIIFINEAGAEIFGYGKRELIGQVVEILYTEEDLPNLRNNIIPALEKFGYWNGLTLGKRKDKTAIDLEINVSTVKDQNGKPQVNIFVFREINKLSMNQID